MYFPTPSLYLHTNEIRPKLRLFLVSESLHDLLKLNSLLACQLSDHLHVPRRKVDLGLVRTNRRSINQALLVPAVVRFEQAWPPYRIRSSTAKRALGNTICVSAHRPTESDLAVGTANVSLVLLAFDKCRGHKTGVALAPLGLEGKIALLKGTMFVQP